MDDYEYEQNLYSEFFLSEFLLNITVDLKFRILAEN